MATLPAGFDYRNFWQYNPYAPGSGDYDCGPATVGCALDLASMGDYDVGIRPSYGKPRSKTTQAARRAVIVKKVRALAGAPGAVPTGQDALRIAFLQFDTEFAAVNRQKPTARKLYPGSWPTDLLPDLVAGKFASMGCWRGPIQPYLGSESFTGKHSILIGNYHLVGGVPYVSVFDPTLDGGQTGSMRGPVDVALSHVKAASDAYTPGVNTASPDVFYGWTFSPRGQIASGQGITAISVANPTHVTTAAAHGLATNDYVSVAGSNSTPPLSGGPYQVTVLDSTHFTVPVNVTVAGTAGTWSPAEPPGVGSGEVPIDPCSLSG